MLRLATALICLLALLPAAPALASTRDKIIQDCADDGVLQGHYSPSALRDARQHLPSDIAEYTDCADVIRRAELGDGSGGGGGNGGGAGSAATGGGGGALLEPATDAENQALADAEHEGAKALKIQEQSVVPGGSARGTHIGSNSVPGAVIAALILLALGGLALAAPGVRRELPGLVRRLPWPGRHES
jgi:hypothetical protein